MELRPTDGPLISVIIPNWNGASLLHLPLDSLRAQSFSRFETIVVDNGSTDDSVEMVRRCYPEVRVVEMHRNAGFPAAVNAGFAAAQGPCLALLNSDAAAAPDWLDRLWDATQESPGVDEFACRVRFYHFPTHLDSAGQTLRTDGGICNRGNLDADGAEYAQPCEVFGGAGAAVMYRRRMIDDVGPMDEQYFAYFEDADLSFRGRLAGYRCLYVPSAIVYHIGQATTACVTGTDPAESLSPDLPPSSSAPSRPSVRLSDFIMYHSVRNRILFIWKNFPVALLWRSLPVLALAFGALVVNLCRNGRTGLLVRTLRDTARLLPVYTLKRKAVQRQRHLSDTQLLALCEVIRVGDLLAGRKRARARTTRTGATV